MLYRRWWVPLIVVAALGGCGDDSSGRDDGGTPDDAGVVDGASDAPVDAAIDAPPRCGDQHLDPGEQCDGVVGLANDGCSPSCTTESSLTWTNLTPSPIPKRLGQAMAYDSAHHRLVVFGGRPAYNLAPTNDTWEWDGSTQNQRWFSFGGGTRWDTWTARSDSSDSTDQCDGTDGDGDGLKRCADPDCWWRCDPLCAPGETSCDPNRARCGDGTCSAIESTALCPADCP